jgi:hypothetical protein
VRLSGKTGFALLLIGCGILIVLSFFGFGLDSLVGLMIPAAMAVLGYIGIKNGKPIIGWILLIVGIVGLIGQLSGLIGFLVALGFIVCGLSMLKRHNHSV